MSECEFDNAGDISRDNLSRSEHVRREIAARRELREWEEQQATMRLQWSRFLDVVGPC